MGLNVSVEEGKTKLADSLVIGGTGTSTGLFSKDTGGSITPQPATLESNSSTGNPKDAIFSIEDKLAQILNSMETGDSLTQKSSVGQMDFINRFKR